MSQLTLEESPTAIHARARRMSDEALLLEYRQTADSTMFAELVHRYEHELPSYLYGRFADATLADDAFQLAFLQIHLKCDQFEEGRKFRPWLYRIAMNSAIDMVRRNKRHHATSLNAVAGEHEGGDGQLLDTLVCEGPMPGDHLNQKEQAHQCRTAVTRLPDRLKCVVDLIFFKGLKYQDAAETLSLPIGTVKSRLHEAVRKLRVKWNSEFAV